MSAASRPANPTDLSNGWESVAATFAEEGRRSTVGVAIVRAWALRLPRGGAVLDLGCGPGVPRSAALVEEGLSVFGVDASPTLAAAFARRFPGAQVACEAAEASGFFGRTFDGALAWGLMFLLTADAQRALVQRVARALKPDGRFLFTAPVQACTWADLSTGRESLSLGADAYRAILSDAGLALVGEHEDEGENHYYEAVRT